MHFRNINFHSFLSLCSPPMDSVKTPPCPGVSQEKLRLMCSYGGLFFPRPHDKSLSYVGGDNRILAVHRYSSLSQLRLHLSRTLPLGGRPFIIKYHLPGDDFDSLISITNDEDLQLMTQEYDRVTAASPLRLFLFFCEPDTAISIHDAKQEDTIHDSGILVSDASAVDCSARPGGPPPNDSGNNLEALAVIHKNKQIVCLADDVNKESDSLLVETSSGSLSSSPSMSSLPPTGADDSGSGRLKQQQSPMEELFANLNFATTEDGCAVSSAALASPVIMVTGHNTNGVTCDARTGDGLSLPSSYSVVSESRIASTSSYSSKSEHANIRIEIQRNGVEECGYRITSQVDQNNQNEQFVHHVQQVAIPSHCPVYAIPVVPTQPIRVTPQSGPASTVLHNNTAPTPAFQQHYYVAFPQFHGPLRSNIAFAPAHIASPTLWF